MDRVTPKVGEPEVARRIEDEVVRRSERPPATFDVQQRRRTGLEIDTLDAGLRSISCAAITLTPIGYRAVVSSKRVAVTVTGGPTATAGSAACAGMMDAEVMAAITAAASGTVDVIGLMSSPMGCARPPRAKKRIGNAVGIYQ